MDGSLVHSILDHSHDWLVAFSPIAVALIYGLFRKTKRIDQKVEEVHVLVNGRYHSARAEIMRLEELLGVETGFGPEDDVGDNGS